MLALVTKYLEFILAATGVIVALGAGLKRIYSTARHIEVVLDKVTQLDTRFARLEEQFRNNGGSTMRDQTDRIESELQSNTARTAALENLVKKLESERVVRDA